MRTVEEERVRYNWLTTAEVAEEIGAEVDYVRALIREGELGDPGDVMDIGRKGRHMYRIHPRAVSKFRQGAVERYQTAVAERRDDDE